MTRPSPSDAPEAEPRPKVADRDEILVMLSQAARRGNVPAMRLLLEELRIDGTSEAEAPSVIDQLAAKRQKAAAIG